MIRPLRCLGRTNARPQGSRTVSIEFCASRQLPKFVMSSSSLEADERNRGKFPRRGSFKLGMAAGTPDSLERLSHADLIGVVRDLIGEVGRLRAENEKVNFALTQLKAEHQAVKDELARLKNLPPRPPHKPSGMDKATERGGSGGGGEPSAKGEKSSRRRGSQLDKLTIDATVVVRAKAPAGSRHKGYEDIVVQDLSLSPQVMLYPKSGS